MTREAAPARYLGERRPKVNNRLVRGGEATTSSAMFRVPQQDQLRSVTKWKNLGVERSRRLLMARKASSGWEDAWEFGKLALAGYGVYKLGQSLLSIVKPDIRQEMVNQVRRRVADQSAVMWWRQLILATTRGIPPYEKAGRLIALHQRASRLTWIADPMVRGDGDYAAPPEHTERIKAGDCDDQALYLATLYAMDGHPASFVFHPKENPSHALVSVFAETTQLPRLGPCFYLPTTGGSAVFVEPQAPIFGVLAPETADCLNRGDYELRPI